MALQRRYEDSIVWNLPNGEPIRVLSMRYWRKERLGWDIGFRINEEFGWTNGPYLKRTVLYLGIVSAFNREGSLTNCRVGSLSEVVNHPVIANLTMDAHCQYLALGNSARAIDNREIYANAVLYPQFWELGERDIIEADLPDVEQSYADMKRRLFPYQLDISKYDVTVMSMYDYLDWYWANDEYGILNKRY